MDADPDAVVNSDGVETFKVGTEIAKEHKGIKHWGEVVERDTTECLIKHDDGEFEVMDCREVKECVDGIEYELLDLFGRLCLVQQCHQINSGVTDARQNRAVFSI